MIRLPAPPTFIMFDILLMLLLVLGVQSQSNLEIVVPKDILFTGAKIIKEHKNGQVDYINNGKLIKATSENFSSKYIAIPCPQKVCKEAERLSKSNNLKIAIIGDLHNKIALATLSACNTNASQCNKLTFTITTEGKIDSNMFKKLNPSFADNLGLIASLN